MNKSRRIRILESISTLNEAQAQLEEVLTAEQNALASTPDDEEHSDMRDGMEEIISELENALSSLEDAITTLDSGTF